MTTPKQHKIITKNAKTELLFYMCLYQVAVMYLSELKSSRHENMNVRYIRIMSLTQQHKTSIIFRYIHFYICMHSFINNNFLITVNYKQTLFMKLVSGNIGPILNKILLSWRFVKYQIRLREIKLLANFADAFYFNSCRAILFLSLTKLDNSERVKWEDFLAA